MRLFITFSYLLAAVINLVPVIGVLSNEILVGLYAVPIDSAELSLLLRHRAVLFAIVGGLLAVAAFMPRLRFTAGVAGLVSLLSFILLFAMTGADNARLPRLALIDTIVVVIFIVGFTLHILEDRSGPKIAVDI